MTLFKKFWKDYRRPLDHFWFVLCEVTVLLTSVVAFYWTGSISIVCFHLILFNVLLGFLVSWDFKQFLDFTFRSNEYTVSLMKAVEENHLLLDSDTLSVEVKQVLNHPSLEYAFYHKEELYPFMEFHYQTEKKTFSFEDISEYVLFHEKSEEFLSSIRHQIETHALSFAAVKPTDDFVYQDKVTEKIEQLFDKLETMKSRDDVSLKMKKWITEEIPNDLTSLYKLYISFNEKSKQIHKHVILETIQLFENKLEYFNGLVETEKERKLLYLEQIFQEKYKERM